MKGIRSSILFWRLAAAVFLGPVSAKGYQKLFYLPEPHTDFIFSVIGEELGMLGVLMIISALQRDFMARYYDCPKL